MSVDLAIINAIIRTMNPNQPTAQALAISQNKLVKVGTNTQIDQLITEKTKVLNFEGKTVVPGLIDTHIHIADYGRCLMWLDLTPAQSISDLQNMLKEKLSKPLMERGLLAADGIRTASKKNECHKLQT